MFRHLASSGSMGTYTDFTVAGYPLIDSKSAVVPEAMTVFRESDKLVVPRRLGDRNPLVWGDSYTDVADECESATLYSCSTTLVIARFDVMGFTIARSRREFESGRLAELAMCEELAADDPDASWAADKIALLESLDFDKYLEALREVVRDGLRPRPFKDIEKPDLSPNVRYILDDNEDNLLGYFTSDIRCLIRATCEVATVPSEVVQDITDLVAGGYYSHDDAVCQQSINSLSLGHLETSNRIVITEGATDSHALQSSMRLLYPHLSDYYSFLDFDGIRVPGGAGYLASLVKGFAAAGIGNRVIAVFDNDSAARDAMRTLAQLRLPPNISVLKYPDIELLRSYPTLGPSGESRLDVNGLAASMELYFGEDVLTRPDGSLSPVQWKGYIEGVASYQGEVVGKSAVQAAFLRKLAAAQDDQSAQSAQDWSGMDAILQTIFGAFKNQD